MEKGTICVTGGDGFLASRTIRKLLEEGYSVHATVISDPDTGLRKDVSHLTKLPGAAERLKIFDADLRRPETYAAPITGCIGVFHIAYPSDPQNKEPEHVLTEIGIKGSLGILQACIDSKTVKKVVYTSSSAAIAYRKDCPDILDEESWSDIDLIRSYCKDGWASYYVMKTLVEKATLEFAEKKGLELVSVIPTFMQGPFDSPHCPSSVSVAMSIFLGDTSQLSFLAKLPYVHVDDVARAHIYLFEHPTAKGRYVCSKEEVTIEEVHKYLSAKYPEYKIPDIDFLKDVKRISVDHSSKRLLGTGFKFNYGMEEMFDDAINCCKRNNIL